MGDTLGHGGREAGKVLPIPSTREKSLAAESKKKATMMAAFIVLLVPSPLVEKRSDPYHGSVLPLNYEGGMHKGFPLRKEDYRRKGKTRQQEFC